MRKSRMALAVASAFPLALCVGVSALAQTVDSAGNSNAPVKELGVVTISGGQPTSLPTQIPTTIEGVTREQIEHSINATDSEDALKYLPSLLVRKRYIGDYNHAVLSTRASGTGNPARSMVFADGILLSNYLGNGPTNAPRWMLVTPEEIERVDVLYGPFSAAYAGNSVGAVVDYVTRMPTKFEAHGQVSYQHQPFDLYNTNATYAGKQVSASVGNKNGDWSWFLNFNKTDSEGQPLTFPTRLVSAGAVGNAGTPVTGAVLGNNRSNQPWYLLGTATQYHTQQDHIKAKIAYDFSPTVRAAYTFGWWHNESEGRPTSYLRDANGNAVYGGTVNINGRSYTLAPTDFNVSNENLTHFMHGLSVKSNTKGVFDWEVAASLYDYQTDTLRAATVALPAALNGGAGRIVNSKGTGWNTLAAKGTWRPDGVQGAHIVDFGLQRDSYQLRTVENATTNWINGAAGARTQAFNGDTQLLGLWAQDTWKIAPKWKAVLGARAERWSASNGQTGNATTTVGHPERNETYVSPKAAVAYQANDLWVLKASTGRAVRMPTVSELYQGGISGSGTLINNDPNLKPEKSWTTELTAERDMGNGLLRLTAFFERTKDALYSQTNVLVTPNVTNVQNVDAILTKGLELSYQATNVFMRGLELGSSLTWTDSKITRNDKFPASVGKWQPRIPEWRASAVATYRPDDKWSYTLGARYSGQQYSTLDNTDVNGFAYQGASRYFTTDVRVRYQITKQVSAAVGIDNLNNYQFWNFHPYPQRTYLAELKVSL
ncbi:MAG: TonB-dependent receptor [Burkholderiales bacterium RIFCSPHIGHO2_12_FULL_65_48]|nr:MAG: TonB-dependent receptor [Burkholderiales bacterium RIFCSPHIGHO2_02_FULL_64_19]OGB17887.1 MAG: TonB-dependent receptor [Burkholderiales bacterium RIFCSPHIGHO2_12_FULL_65_48]OGB54724.1 MAG: TonB-dependent receptor [Burkholderiales bacterium RIFCSPLOWO2_12_FULL_64_33]